MKGRIIFAQEKEFTNDKQELVRGINLVFLNEETGETHKHFLSNDNLKGFDPQLVSTIKGKEIELSTTAKTYNGKTRIVVDKITPL